MKHAFTKLLNLILFVSALAAGVRAQDITIDPVLTMSPNPSPYLSDWQSRRETMTLLATLDRPYNEPVKLMAQVSLNGNVLATTKPENMPVLTLQTGLNTFNAEQIIPYNAVSFKGNIDRSAQRLGRLPEGRYEFCAWFINATTGARIASSQCQPFMIIDVDPPELIAPDNGARFSATTTIENSAVPTGHQFTLDGLAKLEPHRLLSLNRIDIVSGNSHAIYTIDPRFSERDTAEAMQIPILCRLFQGVANNDNGVTGSRLQFQWLPPMPIASDRVEYRLRIVEVLHGQTAEQAMMTGAPVVDRDKILTNTYPVPMEEVSMNYGRFAWAVQAHDPRGTVVGRNNGWSKPRVFDIGDPDFDLLNIDTDSPKTKLVVLESFFDVFAPVDLLPPGFRINGAKQEPCPYKYKVRKGVIYVRDADGLCKMYAIFDVFKCTLHKGHGGPHHGAITTVYVLSGKVTCPDGKGGDPEPPKDKIIDRTELDKIPFKEEADKADVGVKAVGKEPCPHVEKKLLRTVVGPWIKVSTTVRRAAWRKTVVAWVDVVWKRDVFNVYSVSKCTLAKGHGGAHKMGPAVESKELYGSFTEKVTYGPGESQVPPKPHASDAVPEE